MRSISLLSYVRITAQIVLFPKTNFVFPVRIYFVYLHDKTSEKNTQGVNKGRKSAVSIICWLFPLCFDSRVSALRQIFRRQLIDKKWQGFQQQMDERIMGKERAFLHIQICFSQKLQTCLNLSNMLQSCAAASFLNSFQIQMQIKFDGLSM